VKGERQVLWVLVRAGEVRGMQERRRGRR